MPPFSVPSSAPRRIRQRWGPLVNRVARTFGRPVTRVRPAGYVGTVRAPIQDVEAALRDGGFSWDPVSLYHYTREGDDADGSWAYRASWFADRQLHVVLFAEGDAVTEVYAHDEFNWSRHPVCHARQVDIRRAAASARMRRWLEARDLECEHDPAPLRKVRHAVTRLRERFSASVARP